MRSSVSAIGGSGWPAPASTPAPVSSARGATPGSWPSTTASTTAPPVVARPSAIRPAIVETCLIIVLLRYNPAKPATAAGIDPASASPAATLAAAAAVLFIRPDGTAARAVCSSTPAIAPIAGARPLRARPDRRRSRARCRRLCTVPIGHRSRRATCSWESPSRWQSTTADRYRAGNRAISASIAARRSARSQGVGHRRRVDRIEVIEGARREGPLA